MRVRLAVLLLALCGCAPDPAELVVSLVEPATATAQYFHGNCFAGFSVAADIRVQETQGVGVVLSKLSHLLNDRGTGELLAEQMLDTTGIEERYGESAIPARGTVLFRVGGVSERPVGPIAVAGEIRAVDENGESVATPFDLSAPLVVNDPGPPSGGACSP